MGGAAGINFPGIQSGAPQQGPVGQKGAGGQYPSMPQYGNQPAQYANPIYQKMIGNNGNAPTADMLSGLGVVGRPAHLMRHNQEQAVNNRRNDINGLYQEMFGREGDGGGLDYWLNTGQSRNDLMQDFADTPEYQGLVAQGLRKPYDPKTYKKPEEQKAEADANALAMEDMKKQIAELQEQNFKPTYYDVG